MRRFRGGARVIWESWLYVMEPIFEAKAVFRRIRHLCHRGQWYRCLKCHRLCCTTVTEGRYVWFDDNVDGWCLSCWDKMGAADD